MIAIIAILASMLLPALSKARNKARKIVCANNLKQLALPLFLYGEDHQGVFLPHVITNIYAFSVLYTKGYFDKFSSIGGDPLAIACINCPCSQVILPDIGKQYTKVNTCYVHYAFNPLIHRGATDLATAKIVTANRVIAPSQAFELIDASYYSLSVVNFAARIVSGGMISPTYLTNVNTRHDKTANLLYVDGHVDSLSHGELLRKVPADANLENLAFWYGRGDTNNSN